LKSGTKPKSKASIISEKIFIKKIMAVLLSAKNIPKWIGDASLY
jgi:hypothetical protein